MEIKITGLNPKFAEAIAKVLQEAKARGLAVGLHSGLRSIDDQNKLYELGRSIANVDGQTEANPMGNTVTKTVGGFSWHNYGLAADIVYRNPAWTWEMPYAKWEELGNIGEMYGLEWGGRWTRFPDLPHFQLRGNLKNHRLSELRKAALEKGIDAVWALL
jgi:peptidoglycan L-alanyl-D-glutamate endopeptidase CwlK